MIAAWWVFSFRVYLCSLARVALHAYTAHSEERERRGHEREVLEKEVAAVACEYILFDSIRRHLQQRVGSSHGSLRPYSAGVDEVKARG